MNIYIYIYNVLKLQICLGVNLYLIIFNSKLNKLSKSNQPEMVVSSNGLCNSLSCISKRL